MKNLIYSPLASLVLTVLSGSFFLTFSTIKAESVGITAIELGLIHSAFYMGVLIGAVKSESFINRIGHIRSFTSCASVLSISILILSLYQGFGYWLVFRFIAGFATASTYVIIESWLLCQSTKSNKGKILSVYMVCLYSSQTFGQLCLELVDINSIEPFILSAIVSTIAIIPASMTYLDAPEIKPLPKLAINKYFFASPLGFIGCIASGLILSAIYSFLPKYATSYELPASMLLGATIAGGFCLQIPIGKLSDKFERVRIVSYISIFVSAICLIMLLVNFSNEYVLYSIMFLLGGLCFTIYPISIAQVCDHLEDDSNIVSVTGTLLFAYGIGAVFGPPIISLVVELFSSSAFFYYILFISSSLFIFGVYTNKAVNTLKAEDQVEFIAMPRISPIANKLDPRANDGSISTNDEYDAL